MKKNLLLPVVISAVIALVIGSALTYGAIYEAYQTANPITHFHANFTIYIEGKKVDLSGDKYMEDIGSCSVANQTPRERVHMHEHEGDLVHVHAPQVTWGAFFTNLGMTVDGTHLITSDGTIYTSDQTNHMSFILNGKAINSPSNTYIKSEDRLLINFGSESEQDLATRLFLSVPQTAHKENQEKDPASCGSGSTKRAFTFRFWDPAAQSANLH